ncbi:MAG: type II secretion system F family protein, partial [Planctomycetaceae bacterium]
MPDYQYTARQTSGQQTTGILSAANEQDALSSLSARSLFPIQIGLAESAKAQEVQSRRRVPVRFVTTFFTQLADLLRSGVSLMRSLQLLERQSTHGGLQFVIRDVSEKVADGNRLADALGRHPRVFGALAVSMVRAGEEGSFLEDVLKRISGFQEHQEELKGRVVGAMVYPLFLLTAGTVIVVWMLVQFVPKFAGIFDRMAADGQLPWATTTLLGISETMQTYWLLCLLGFSGSVFLLVQWGRTESGRQHIDRFWLNAKGLGPIVRSLALARFTRILGTLLQNGVPVLHSLRIAKDAAGNVVLSQAIGSAAD